MCVGWREWQSKQRARRQKCLHTQPFGDEHYEEDGRACARATGKPKGKKKRVAAYTGGGTLNLKRKQISVDVVFVAAQRVRYTRSSCLDKLRIRDSCSLVLQTALASFFVHWCFRAYFCVSICAKCWALPPQAPIASTTNGQNDQPKRRQAGRRARTLEFSVWHANFPGRTSAKSAEGCKGCATKKIDSQWRIVESVHKHFCRSQVLWAFFKFYREACFHTQRGKFISEAVVSRVHAQLRTTEGLVANWVHRH